MKILCIALLGVIAWFEFVDRENDREIAAIEHPAPLVIIAKVGR